jgi:hypothetical protein
VHPFASKAAVDDDVVYNPRRKQQREYPILSGDLEHNTEVETCARVVDTMVGC